MTPMQTLKTACSKYFDHADAIISHETERRFALAQADKCTNRRDMRGYEEWLSQARHFTTQSLIETSKAGIVGNSAHADGFSSTSIIARMSE